MRPTNIFNKNRRKKRGTGNINSYKQQAAAEYKQVRLLLGSSGAASPVRKIDPTTGAVIETLKQPKPNST
jgi:hypothetical protein